MIMRRFQKGEIFDHAQVSERVNFSIRRICQKRETEHMPERKIFSREMSPEKKEPDRAPFRSNRQLNKNELEVVGIEHLSRVWKLERDI